MCSCCKQTFVVASRVICSAISIMRRKYTIYFKIESICSKVREKRREIRTFFLCLTKHSCRVCRQTTLFFILLTLPVSCTNDSPDQSSGSVTPQSMRVKSEKYGVSFIPPQGWSVFHDLDGECPEAIGAKKDNLQIYMCVSKRPEGLLFVTGTPAVDCSLLEDFIREKIKGYAARCFVSSLAARKALEVSYMRLVSREGKLLSQFVHQFLLPQGKTLYTVTAFSEAPSEEEARTIFQQNTSILLKSMKSFWIHHL